MRKAVIDLLLIGAVACAFACSSGDDEPAAGSGGSGGAGGASGGGAGAMGGTGGGGAGGLGGASGMAGGAGGAAGTMAGAGGMTGGAGGMTGGTGGMTGGAGGMTGEPPITECDGVMLPPRAIASTTPHVIGPAAAGLPEYFPTDGWQSMSPEMLGLDPVKLDAAINFSTASSNTQAVMVVRHGYVAAEEYFSGSASTRHESYSMAKSFSSTLIGIAIDQGLVASVDEKLCTYYPTYWDCADTSDPRGKITIDHALNISTGLRWSENWRSDATGTNDVFLASVAGMLETVLGREAVEEPGTHMRYSTGDPSLLSGVFEMAAGKSALEYGQDVLFGPLGMSGIQWGSDGQGRTTTYAGMQATAQEYAKLGLLFLNKGKWDGEQIVSEAWVDKTTQGPEPCTDWYRYLWHQNPPARLGTQPATCGDLHCPPTAYADLPPDTFFAEGINGQFIFIIPSTDMVVVRLANDGPGSETWDEYAAEFLRLMLDAVM